ncbi:MAG: hypothetical protein MUE83_14555, partial [Tabrizicola sp.]|nr:hypothetical protein [Tabrizicola sp.]
MTMFRCKYIVFIGEVVHHIAHPECRKRAAHTHLAWFMENHAGARPRAARDWAMRLVGRRETPMGLSKTIWTNPVEMIRNMQPENPVLF